MDFFKEIFGYLRVVAGHSIVSCVSLCNMGLWKLSIHSHGLEDLLTVLVKGVQPGDDGVLDVAGHTLDIHWNPMWIKLFEREINKILNEFSEGWCSLILLVCWCCPPVLSYDFFPMF